MLVPFMGKSGGRSKRGGRERGPREVHDFKLKEGEVEKEGFSNRLVVQNAHKGRVTHGHWKHLGNRT